jgi:hypothetical protein
MAHFSAIESSLPARLPRLTFPGKSPAIRQKKN